MGPQVTLKFLPGASKQEISEALFIAGTDISLDVTDLRVDRDIMLRDNVGKQVGTMYFRGES